MIVIIGLVVVLVFVGFGVRIVRPTHRGVVERLGKYNRLVGAGFYWVIPVVEHMMFRNITERLADVEPQDVITKDNMNARVDLQVYFKVVDTEDCIKKSYYGVEDFKSQIIAIAQTTTRNVIGDMKFVEVNSQRASLNNKLKEAIDKQIEAWGVDVVRVELKEITPPEEVQATMNKVIMAQNEKDAAVDVATALETKADGERRAAIKVAEGHKQAQILNSEGSAQSQVLEAEGKAKAIQMVSEASDKFFKGNAVELEKLKTVQISLANNTKVILTKDGITPDLLFAGLFGGVK